ncbi:MAG: hypothetical protein OEY26_00085 [Nitrospinota bacterium]|nr:hypothetical protein [Nitrospinota bacterium]
MQDLASGWRFNKHYNARRGNYVEDQGLMMRGIDKLLKQFASDEDLADWNDDQRDFVWSGEDLLNRDDGPS